VNKSPPDQTLKPHYVYGYRCADIRHNLYYNEGYGNVVYCIASIGVIMNKASKDQILFGCGENKTTKGHTDDIISLAVCPHRRLVATGETGRNPKVYVWSAQTGEIMSFYKCKRVRGIKTIGFSKSSKYVGFSCLDNDHTVYLVDPHGKKKCKLLGSGKGGPGAFFDMAFSTVDEGTFVTIGKRSKYWTYENGVLDSCSLKFGSQKRTTLIVGTFTDQGTLVCGGSNGRLYIC
jgi:WD40 repeat protein